jgi:hypothetical protein
MKSEWEGELQFGGSHLYWNNIMEYILHVWTLYYYCNYNNNIFMTQYSYDTIFISLFYSSTFFLSIYTCIFSSSILCNFSLFSFLIFSINSSAFNFSILSTNYYHRQYVFLENKIQTSATIWTPHIKC